MAATPESLILQHKHPFASSKNSSVCSSADEMLIVFAKLTFWMGCGLLNYWTDLLYPMHAKTRLNGTVWLSNEIHYILLYLRTRSL